MSNSETEWTLESWLGDCHISHGDMNRLIMDYLLTEGYKEAAEKFREEAGVDFSSDAYSETLEARIQIRQAVQDGRVQDAIAMINDLHPELLENNNTLHFHLLQQQIIELIRKQQIEEALTFAQEHLAEKGEENPKVLTELERTLALLAFENPEQSPFGDLMQLSHRQRVSSEVNAAILEAGNSSSKPKLESLAQLVMWAQEQLDKGHIQYPKMVNIGEAVIQNFKSTSKPATN